MMLSVRSVMRRLLPAIAVPMLLGACEDRTRLTDAQQGALRVDPERATYAPGNRVGLTLQNDSTVAINLGPCASALLHLVGGDAWGEIDGYDRACDAVLLRAAPGASLDLSAQLPSSLPPGQYRTRHDYRIEGQATGPGHWVYSVPFEVR